MTIIEKIKFEEDWLSEVNLTSENVKIAFAGIRATALEQQPCENAISREAVIEWLKDKDIIKTKNQEENAKRELDELPSVTPTIPEVENNYNIGYNCGYADAMNDIAESET